MYWRFDVEQLCKQAQGLPSQSSGTAGPGEALGAAAIAAAAHHDPAQGAWQMGHPPKWWVAGTPASKWPHQIWCYIQSWQGAQGWLNFQAFKGWEKST